MRKPIHWPWQHKWVAWLNTGGMYESCSCGKVWDHDQMCYYLFPDKKRPIFDGEDVIGYA